MLGDFFLKVISSLQTQESNNIDLQFWRMSCPTLKSIMKSRREPRITSTQDAHKGSS